MVPLVSPSLHVIRIKLKGDSWTKRIFVQLQVLLSMLKIVKMTNYVFIMMGYSSAVPPFHKEKQTTEVLKSYLILYLVFEPDKGVTSVATVITDVFRKKANKCFK